MGGRMATGNSSTTVLGCAVNVPAEAAVPPTWLLATAL
jgi:hypothetical protein